MEQGTYFYRGSVRFWELIEIGVGLREKFV